MAGGVGFKFYRNYSENDSTFTEPSTITSFPPITNVNGLDWSRAEYVFKGWNALQNGSGTMHQSGDSAGGSESSTFYAIWEPEESEESHDIKITYKGSTITTMDASGTKTLETSGKYCEDDIVVSYTKPSAPTPTLQSKTVSPSTSQQTVSPDSGYDGLSQVTVNAMPSGSATTPATTITANPTISVSESGLITASVSKTQGVTPTVSAGYVSSGTAGTVSVSGSNTQQLTVYNGEHHSN